jgi:ADP-ribose pyrophosphatase YjhB (NUDIX family)
MKEDYISFIRSKVGHDEVFLNFSVAVIFDKKGRILLQKRADKKKWGLPGGVVELGESVEDALIREVEEETGLKAKPIKLLGIYSKYKVSYPNGDRCQAVATVFYVKIVGGSLKTRFADETLGLSYFSKGEIPKLAAPDFEDMVKDAFGGKEAVWR